jgi:hypothetical protein
MNQFKMEVITAEEKSTQQVEKELLEKKEKTDNPDNGAATDPVVTDPPATDPVIEEYDEQKVRGFFKSKFDKEVDSFEGLFAEKEPTVIEKEIELPENVSAYHKYYKETGRSIEDFAKLNRDFTKMNPDQVLAESIAMENPSWSMDEVRSEIQDLYGYDPDELSESDIAKRERSKKTAVANAVSKLESMKEQYASPLASREMSLSEDEKAEYEAFKQWQKEDDSTVKGQQEASRYFETKTKELFSPDFEGFEFSVGEGKSITYKPDSPDKLIKDQSDILSIVQSFLDDKGLIKDVKSYHKAISILRNPDQFAKHAYDQGAADMVVDFEKKSKNIDMTQNANQHIPEQKGPKFEIVGGSEQRLVIKSPKKRE